jgi:hypothetical protein
LWKTAIILGEYAEFCVICTLVEAVCPELILIFYFNDSALRRQQAMRRLFIIFTLFVAIGLAAGPAYALNHVPHVNALNEPGSLLVYPLIDNINGVTIVNIANLGNQDVDIECYSVTHGPGGGIDQKHDFVITLTPKEKFVWMSHQPYNQRGNQIGALAYRKGYLFCWAIDNEYDQFEKTWNYLKGDATFLSLANARAFNYNAIAHQRQPSNFNALAPDKVLALDGHEYTMGTSQIMFEGLAEVHGVLGGTLVVANPGIDFVNSKQPEFDINVYCWNEVETKFSRHLKYKDFEQYDLTRDLQLDISKIFTLGFQCATTSTHALWAVFQQDLGRVFGWGGNVWQHPGSGVSTAVILPDCTDTDDDGFCDGVDNCPVTPNPDQADGNNDGIGDACSMKIVFVTSTPYQGDLANLGAGTGIQNADAECNALAAAQNLPGTYRAWLSDSGSTPATDATFTKSTFPYELVNGTKIADDYTDLTTWDASFVSLDNVINVDETGATVAATVRVWTGTKADGTAEASNHCSNWTSNATGGGAGDTGRIGRVDSTLVWWTTGGTGWCDSSNRLYCFQQ